MNDWITEITEEKRGTRVRFSSGDSLWFSRSLWRQAPLLQPGTSADPEELKQWMLLRQYTPALQCAVTLLARQARSSGEIRQKLKQCHYLPETIEMVLYKLEKERLLNDEEYARQYAASKARNQTGKNRIRRVLQQKGIDSETTDSALEAIDPEDEQEAAAALALKLLRRYRFETDPRKKGMKLLAAMARRGYSSSESKAAIEEAIQTLQEEEL